MIIVVTLTISFSPWVACAESVVAPQIPTASELIDALNTLRAANGRSPFTPNSILMGIAQEQAEYNLAIRMMTDTSADGLRPYQRALLAGYAVAGDISLGGFFTELLYAGRNTSAEEALIWWNNDPPHQAMLLSNVFLDVGTGIATSDGTSYFVLVAGKSTGGAPVPFIPPPTYKTPVATKVPNTPNADGSIVYIVQRNDTALGIAIAYGTSLDKLLILNGLTEKSIIYPDQQIIIRAAYTPTSTLPTSTPTKRPTITSWPSSTPSSTETRVPPTITPSPGLSVSAARGAVIAIAVTALVIAALLAPLGRKRK